MDVEIPADSVMLEVEAKGDAFDLAEKIKKLREVKLLEQDKVRVQVIAKDKKVYIVLTQGWLAEQIHTLVAGFTNVPQKEFKWMEMKMSSNNTFSRINELVRQEGFSLGVRNSLTLEAKFWGKDHTGVMLKNLLGT